jgi:hypothetical protein
MKSSSFQPWAARLRVSLLLAAATAASGLVSAQQPQPPAENSAPAASPFRSMLEFVNGDRFHGRLVSFAAGGDLEWHAPYFNQLVRFPSAATRTIHLVTGPSASPQPAPNLSVVRLTNGDLVLGQVVAINEQTVTLAVPYANGLVLRRANVAEIRPNAIETGHLYLGPRETDAWKSSANKPGAGWQIKNKVMTADTEDITVNMIPLEKNIQVQFDATWTSSCSFWVGLYITDPATPNFANIKILMNETQIFLQSDNIEGNNRISRGLGRLMSINLEPRIPHRFMIRVNRETKELAVSIDNNYIGRIPLQFELPSPGAGLSFGSKNNTTLTLENITVLGGSTNPDPKADKQADRLLLANNQTATGRLLSIQNGLVTLRSASGEAYTSLNQVRIIHMAPASQQRARLTRNDARLWISDLESLTLVIERIDAQTITGTSENFGRATFARGAFTKIEFNIHEKQD